MHPELQKLVLFWHLDQKAVKPTTHKWLFGLSFSSLKPESDQKMAWLTSKWVIKQFENVFQKYFQVLVHFLPAHPLSNNILHYHNNL